MPYRLKLTFAAAILIAFSCKGGSSLGGFDAEQAFQFPLNAASEVPPPRPTSATGSAQIIVYSDEIQFKLAAANITGITMAHIHSGAPNVAGPIVVTLFQPSSPTGAVNGIFASGTLNAGNLPSTVSLASLKTLLASGNSYVNVHTSANPTGEIRGQIR